MLIIVKFPPNGMMLPTKVYLTAKFHVSRMSLRGPAVNFRNIIIYYYVISLFDQIP